VSVPPNYAILPHYHDLKPSQTTQHAEGGMGRGKGKGQRGT
jgi:hypothetical protein